MEAEPGEEGKEEAEKEGAENERGAAAEAEESGRVKEQRTPGHRRQAVDSTAAATDGYRRRTPNVSN